MSNAAAVNALLDGTLDDIADLPEFVVPNAGTYEATILKFEPKEINEQTAIDFQLRFDNLLEAADGNDEPQTLPIEAGTAFFLLNDDGTPNELGQGQWKEVMKAISDHVEGTTNTEKMASAVGLQVVVTTGVRVHKEDKKKAKADQRRYMQLKQVIVG